jgi:hypothetical protein
MFEGVRARELIIVSLKMGMKAIEEISTLIEIRIVTAERFFSFERTILI